MNRLRRLWLSTRDALLVSKRQAFVFLLLVVAFYVYGFVSVERLIAENSRIRDAQIAAAKAEHAAEIERERIRSTRYALALCRRTNALTQSIREFLAEIATEENRERLLAAAEDRFILYECPLDPGPVFPGVDGLFPQSDVDSKQPSTSTTIGEEQSSEDEEQAVGPIPLIPETPSTTTPDDETTTTTGSTTTTTAPEFCLPLSMESQ